MAYDHKYGLGFQEHEIRTSETTDCRDAIARSEPRFPQVDELLDRLALNAKAAEKK